MTRVLSAIPWRLVAWLSMLVSLALFAWTLPGLADGDWSRVRTSAWHNTSGLLVLWALSALARSRTLFNLVGTFLGGYFTAIWIAVLGGRATGSWLGETDLLQLSVAVPVIEELAKLVPLLIVVLVWRWRTDRSPGIVDFTLMGMASGAGFAFHEDGLWQRLSGSGLDSPLGLLWPSMYAETGTAAGHVVWTGLVGLGVGVWMTRAVRRLSWLVPIVLLAVVVADHGIWNNVAAREDWSLLRFDGWLVPGLLLAALLVALVRETWRLHRLTDGLATAMLRRLPSRAVRGGVMVGPRKAWQANELLRGLALEIHGRPDATVGKDS